MRMKDIAPMHTDLKGESIDAVSDWLDYHLTPLGLEKSSVMKVRLLIEEILLRARDNFGEDVKLEINLAKSIAGPYLKIELAGEPFNPLSESNAELGEWNSSLQTAVGLVPRYSYTWGKNVLKLRLPNKRFNPVLKIFLALLLGVLLGIVGHYLVPTELQDSVMQYFLTPTYRLWLRILTAISSPIIFFTVITTMLNTRQIDSQGGDSTHVVMRYFGFSVLIATVSVLVVLPSGIVHFGSLLSREGVAERLLTYGKSLVPKNIIDPFSTANTPQLLLMAFVLGAAIIALGNHVPTLKKLTRQINMVGLKLAEWVSLLVPLVAGLFICLEILQGKTDTLEGMWKPFLLALVVSAAMMLCAVFYAAWRTRVNPLTITKKIQGPFMVALKTGSLDASFEHTKYSCIHLLGIDKIYTNLSLPQGLVLYMPVSAIGTLIFTVFAADVYHVKVDWLWLVTAVIFAVLLFVATPPVPGANLLAYVVFFQWLGIPEVALMDAMIFDIVFGIFAGAGNQLLLQIELLLQARKIGVLSKQKLIKKS